MRLIQHLFVMSLICSAMISPSFADCVPVSQGQKIIIEVSACKEIDASKNSDVQRLARTQDVVALYTGALVKDKKGALWMYPSSGKKSCSQFPVNEKTEKKGYYTVIVNKVVASSYAACRKFSVPDRSGFSHTSFTASQFLVAPDQRSGLRALASA